MNEAKKIEAARKAATEFAGILATAAQDDKVRMEQIEQYIGRAGGAIAVAAFAAGESLGYRRAMRELAKVLEDIREARERAEGPHEAAWEKVSAE